MPINDPVVWWKLDDGTGTTAADSSGNGFTATMSGGASWDTGQFGGSMAFDGVDGALTCDLSSLDGGTDATFAAWVKRTDEVPGGEPSGGFADFGTSGASGSSHYPYINGFLYLGLFNNDNTRPISGYDDTGFDKRNWHHVVITQAPGTDGYKLYRNGSLVTQGTGLSAATFGSDDGLAVGRPGGFIYFDGNFEQVRLYDRALNSTEVSDLYAWTAGGAGDMAWIYVRRTRILNQTC